MLFKFLRKNYNKQAFTLAEVLITFTIVGVIASMTIPSLIALTDNIKNKAMFEKMYSIFTQAQIEI